MLRARVQTNMFAHVSSTPQHGTADQVVLRSDEHDLHRRRDFPGAGWRPAHTARPFRLHARHAGRNRQAVSLKCRQISEKISVKNRFAELAVTGRGALVVTPIGRLRPATLTAQRCRSLSRSTYGRAVGPDLDSGNRTLARLNDDGSAHRPGSRRFESFRTSSRTGADA